LSAPTPSDDHPNSQSPNRTETEVSGPGGAGAGDTGVGGEPGPLESQEEPLLHRVKTLLIGKPRDLTDQSVFSHVSLVAFLAWVGLGADGLSSSCYGPAEAFANLAEHRYLAIFLAAAIAFTVFVISACYSHIIEEFPSGGGGYLVASKLLGPRIGVVSGCALLVDYVMTITVSIAAAGDAVFSLIDPKWIDLKLPAEVAAIGVLIVLNLRGVKESVQILMPIFLIFLVTHVVLIAGSIVLHAPAAPHVAQTIVDQVREAAGSPQIGMLGMLALFLRAYSLGAGTYTGLEAVSNSMPVMREPRVATARRAMRYMAYSLALMAGGLIVAYLLLDIVPKENVTMNYLLMQEFVEQTGLTHTLLGGPFVLVSLLSEGLLLVVAAQAGFIGGPRMLANMAQDSWLPRWFANLSERLATRNGILLMGGAALAALIYTHGDVYTLVIMYSINVFVTFSLSMIGMCRHWFAMRGRNPKWVRRLALFVCGAALCVAILVVTVYEKMYEGGWRTLAVTGVCMGICFFVNRYYREVGTKLKKLDHALGDVPTCGEPNLADPDPSQPAAVILVGGYSGLGIHTTLSALDFVPNHFRSLVFVSVGVVDSGNFKGKDAVEQLTAHTEGALAQYVELGQRLGLPSTSFMAIGTDAVDELEQICLAVARSFPKARFFAGQLVFRKDTWLQRMLHNQTAASLQRRLQWAGLPMVILPTRVR
jgi:amino acid transporter